MDIRKLTDEEIGLHVFDKSSGSIKDLGKFIRQCVKDSMPTEEEMLRIIANFSYPAAYNIPAIDAGKFIELAQALRAAMEGK